MSNFSRTAILFSISVLLGLGMGLIYLALILYFATGSLPDFSQLINSFDQIVEALKGQP